MGYLSLIEKSSSLPVYDLNKPENTKSQDIEEPKEIEPDYQYPKDNAASISSQEKTIPSTVPALEFFGNKPLKEPILNFPGVSQGDNFIVDGPLWYDGEAVLKRFDSNVLELNFNMKATDTFGEIGFKIVDGKINLDIILEKNGDTYNIKTKDNNDDGSMINESGLKIEYGKTSGGLFSSSKNFIKISDGVQTGTTFTINSPGNISIKTNAMPISLDLTKKK